MHRKKILVGSVFLALSGVGQSALAACPNPPVPGSWCTEIDAGRYNSAGTITFNDWGYTGPNGANAGSFAVTSPVTGITGFDPTRIGQKQNVVTLDPDWKTPDPTITSTMAEFFPTVSRPNTSQDAQVNFFQWTYTTVGGSTFNNMTIDKAGNYFVARDDMKFKFYDTFQYHDANITDPNDPNYVVPVDSNINFQPYALSDARGWCGSTLNSNPNAVGIMAGQVTFGLAMDVYMGDGLASPAGGITQIIPNFVMRSYGSYVLNTDRGNYVGSAVMNNNNPDLMPKDANGNVIGEQVVAGAALDPAYQNRVSFLGAGVIPKGVWVKADSYVSPGVKNLNPDGTWAVNIVDAADPICDPSNSGAAPEAGAVCWANFYAGYPFLMRADGQRTLIDISPTGHSDYVATDAAAYTSIGLQAPVPVPAAVWLFGSGLMGLAAVARRKKKA